MVCFAEGKLFLIFAKLHDSLKIRVPLSKTFISLEPYFFPIPSSQGQANCSTPVEQMGSLFNDYYFQFYWLCEWISGTPAPFWQKQKNDGLQDSFDWILSSKNTMPWVVASNLSYFGFLPSRWRLILECHTLGSHKQNKEIEAFCFLDLL